MCVLPFLSVYVLCVAHTGVQIACTGGGSNFGGLVFPILREKMAGKVGVADPEQSHTAQHGLGAGRRVPLHVTTIETVCADRL